MSKSATDVMTDIVTAAVIDAAVAYRTSAKGVPNALWQAIGAVHQNTTPADLPAEVQAAITAAVRDAFGRLRREGYTVAGGEPQRGPATTPRPRPGGPAKPPVVETRRRPGPPRSGPKGPPRGRP
jgi:hypothetical protein